MKGTKFVEQTVNYLISETSDTVLITAYDLLKDDHLVTYLVRSGSTLKEYLWSKGFNKNIKILAYTGIFEFEARRANMDFVTFDTTPHEFTTEDIYFAYKLIDPDFLISPDEIILQTHSETEAHDIVSRMISLFQDTCDSFDKKKIIPVIQGFDEETITPLLEAYKSEHIESLARGGLIPLWRNSFNAFEDVVSLTRNLSIDYGIDNLHSFGLPSLMTIKSYFIDNSYTSLDTSIIYFRTAQREYLSGTNAYICGYASSIDVDNSPKRDFGSKFGKSGGYLCHYIPISLLKPIEELKKNYYTKKEI